MIANRITFAVVSVLALLALAPFALRLQFAQALTDASSSTTTTQSELLTASTSTATTTAPIANSTGADPTALAVSHVVGTKYVDYCTDGSKVTPYPGDPTIDANLNKPDAATPKCPNGLKWDHTSGMDKYDTPSGDLDVGAYAQQADGTYIAHYAASTYRDATSTSSLPDRVVVSKDLPVALPSDTGDAPTTTVQ